MANSVKRSLQQYQQRTIEGPNPLSAGSFRHRVKDSKAATREFCQVLGAFPVPTKLPDEIQSEEAYKTLISTNLSKTSVAQPQEVVSLFTSSISSPAQLLDSEVAQLKAIITHNGLTSPSITHFLDLLKTQPINPDSKKELQVQKKEVQLLRKFLIEYYRDHKQAPRDGAAADLQMRLTCILPQSVQKAFLAEQRDKLHTIFRNCHLPKNQIDKFLEKYTQKTKDRAVLNFMIAFVLAKPEAADYHPKEALALYQSLTKQALPKKSFEEILDLATPFKFNKTQNALLRKLYFEFQKTHSAEETQQVKEYLLLYLRERRDKTVTNSLEIFNGCKRALQFWDHLTHQPTRAEMQDQELGVLYCHAKLFGDAQNVKDVAIQRAKLEASAKERLAAAFPNGDDADSVDDAALDACVEKIFTLAGHNPSAALTLFEAISVVRKTPAELSHLVRRIEETTKNTDLSDFAVSLFSTEDKTEQRLMLRLVQRQQGRTQGNSPALLTFRRAAARDGHPLFEVERCLLPQKPLLKELKLALTEAQVPPKIQKAILEEFSTRYDKSKRTRGSLGKEFALELLQKMSAGQTSTQLLIWAKNQKYERVLQRKLNALSVSQDDRKTLFKQMTTFPDRQTQKTAMHAFLRDMKGVRQADGTAILGLFEKHYTAPVSDAEYDDDGLPAPEPRYFDEEEEPDLAAAPLQPSLSGGFKFVDAFPPNKDASSDSPTGSVSRTQTRTLKSAMHHSPKSAEHESSTTPPLQRRRVRWAGEGDNVVTAKFPAPDFLED